VVVKECCLGRWKVATTRDDQGSAGSTTYWSGATGHYNRRHIMHRIVRRGGIS